MTTNRQLAINWVKGSGTDGKGSNMFWHGDVIFSYGTHFPIACRYTKDLYTFTCLGYSSTTGKHKSYVWDAISDKKVFLVPHVVVPLDRNVFLFERYHKENISYLIDETKKSADRIRNARSKKYKYINDLYILADMGIEYIKYFKVQDILDKSDLMHLILSKKAAEGKINDKR